MHHECAAIGLSVPHRLHVPPLILQGVSRMRVAQVGVSLALPDTDCCILGRYDCIIKYDSHILFGCKVPSMKVQSRSERWRMAKERSAIIAGGDESEKDERFDSWKEIATYLKRAVRTVRRWEALEELPVRRHRHRVSCSVYAFKGELDSWRAHRGPQPRTSSIVLAVLPFENLSGHRRHECLSDSLTAEVVTQLASFSPTMLRVIALRSTKRFKHSTEAIDKIAEALSATHIVGGTVRFASNCALITVQLLRAVDQTHLWAERYGRRQSNKLWIQGEIARSITRSVIAQLFPAEVTPHARWSAQHGMRQPRDIEQATAVDRTIPGSRAIGQTETRAVL